MSSLIQQARKAAQHGSLSKLLTISSRGLILDPHDPDIDNLLFHAVRGRNFEVIDYLIVIGVDKAGIAAKVSFNRACGEGDGELLEHLIALGITIPDKDKHHSANYAYLRDSVEQGSLLIALKHFNDQRHYDYIVGVLIKDNNWAMLTEIFESYPGPMCDNANLKNIMRNIDQMDLDFNAMTNVFGQKETTHTLLSIDTTAEKKTMSQRALI